MTLFLPEIVRDTTERPRFRDLRRRLLSRIRVQVRNGEVTERRLARRAGLSQPHVHHLLKGIRSLTANSADALLEGCGISVLDLLTENERADIYQLEAASRQPRTGVKLLAEPVGEGSSWSGEPEYAATIQVACRALWGAGEPLAVLARADPEMEAPQRVLLIDRALGPRLFPESRTLYVVTHGRDTLVRWVRLGLRHVYFLSAIDRNRPDRWMRQPLPRDLSSIIHARVHAIIADGIWPLPDKS